MTLLKNRVFLAGILFFVTLTVEGQWYYRNCGARSLTGISEEAFDCLWKKSNTIATVGKIFTGTGTTLAVAGGITMVTANPCTSSGQFLIGGLVLMTGLAIDVLFVPVWAVGAGRKSVLRATAIYKQRPSLSIRISPVIENVQTSNYVTLGLSATLRF